MQNLKLITDYKNNDDLRISFNELATKTFGINFENWYQEGYWTEKYNPFSFVDQNKIIANISVNKIDLLVEGERMRGLQIGTVMTHSDYRNKGLSRKLMEHILKEYENQYDIMYLFANHTVLEFYPKFGFQALEEYQFESGFEFDGCTFSTVRKLDGTKRGDLQFIYQFASNRVPLSSSFSTLDTQELLMFYCMYVFTEDLYYIEDEEIIVICKQEEDQLHVFDIISKKTIDYKKILHQIAGPKVNKVVYHFTPDCDEHVLKKEVFNGSEVLFVKTNLTLPKYFKHPITSQS